MEYNEQNWKNVLKALHFKEENNATFGGKVIYDDNDIPRWSYDNDDEEYKEKLYHFLAGAMWMRAHMEMN